MGCPCADIILARENKTITQQGRIVKMRSVLRPRREFVGGVLKYEKQHPDSSGARWILLDEGGKSVETGRKSVLILSRFHGHPLKPLAEPLSFDHLR